MRRRVAFVPECFALCVTLRGLTSGLEVNHFPLIPLQQHVVGSVHDHCAAKDHMASHTHTHTWKDPELGPEGRDGMRRETLTYVVGNDSGLLETQSLQSSLRDPLQHPALEEDGGGG